MSEKEAALKLITQEELLEGLLVITKGNMGFACSLLKQVIDKTREEFEIILKEMNEDIDTLKRRARDEATRDLKANMDKSPWHGPQPEDTSPHHIAGWGDPRAEPALWILLRFNIPFDHEALGCYLPRSRTRTPHPVMPNAPAHNTVHTKHGYENVAYMVNLAAQVPGATQEDIIKICREIGRRLQAGTFPIHDPLSKKE